MPRRKIPGRVILLFAMAALILTAAMDLLAPGSYLRALLDPERPFLSPTQRIERLFDRAFRSETPTNPFR